MTIRTYKSEADVKKYVKQILTAYGFKWWMPPANGYGQNGISDFNALRGGVFLAIETKFYGNTITVNQERFLNDVLSQDGIAFVVDETTVDTLEKWCEVFDIAISFTAKGEKIPTDVGARTLECVRLLTEPIAFASINRAARNTKRRSKDQQTVGEPDF